MTDSSRYHARRSRLKAAIAANDLDALVVTHPVNVTYLTGFTGSNGQIVVTAADSSVDTLFTDRRYEGRVQTDTDLNVTYGPFLPAILATPGTVGMEAQHVSWASARQLLVDSQAKRVTLSPTTNMVEELRQYKDSYEHAQLTAACQITVDALNHLFEHTRLEGVSERAIAHTLQQIMQDFGADGDAFAPIVATGVNGAIPHHSPTDRIVAKGELLTIDCGARLNGYHADCTRTVAIGTAPNSELAAIYAVVRDAQQAATAALTANTTAGEVDDAARSVIETAGYGAAFVHGTGHGVGLEIHEAPLIGPKATARLQATVVCTSEPGIYLPGVGGVRIEDTVVVTASGAPQILTDCPR
ncbi:MAG: Xaa-Pro peptidase family protein, partial [Nitriliruptoraceae bacterium]